MKTTEITLNLDGLEEMKNAIGSSMRARVGVLGGSQHQNEHLASKNFKNNTAATRRVPADDAGLSNAELMLIMMFGSLKKNIPARDPLLTPLIRHRRELIQKLGTGSMRAAFMAGDYKKMFTLLGIAAEGIVQEAFETSGDGSWKGNAQSTIDAKGSSQPLIDTAQLRQSISSDVARAGSSGAAISGGVSIE